MENMCRGRSFVMSNYSALYFDLFQQIPGTDFKPSLTAGIILMAPDLRYYI